MKYYLIIPASFLIYISSKNLEAGYFKVAIDSPVDFEIKFNWWVIN